MTILKIAVAAFLFCTTSCEAITITKTQQKTFIFDFDHTIHNSPISYPELIGISSLGKEKYKSKIPEIYEYYKTLKQQNNLSEVAILQKIMAKYHFKITQKDLDYSINQVKKYITKDIKSTIMKIKSHGHKVIIIGGGTYGCGIIPEVVKTLGIEKDQIYSGYFKDFTDQSISKTLFDNYRYTNCGNPDQQTPISDKKSDLIKHLKQQNIISEKAIHIGDGENDLEVWQASQADLFIGFGVHRIAKKVEKNAPVFVKSMAELNQKIDELI
jgi:phosphoserine phosphatase